MSSYRLAHLLGIALALLLIAFGCGVKRAPERVPPRLTNGVATGEVTRSF